MDERIARVLRSINDFGQLLRFEENIRRQKALTTEVEVALTEKAATLSRSIISDRTGLDLAHLSPAEERIVQAVCEYVGVMRRRGKDATRTLLQLRNRGLIESAEVAVAKARPTQGFQVLRDEDLEDLSYEQIVLDYPQEFSERAAWYARRTLGLPNTTDRAPPRKLGATKEGETASTSTTGAPRATRKINPDWTREEHVLALDLYMKVRNASYSDEHPDVVD